MSVPSLLPSPHIVISYVTNVGEAAVAAACETHKVFSRRRQHRAREGTVVVVVNKDLLAITAVKILGGAFQERHMLEPSIFTGDLVKYNYTEAPVALSHTFHNPLPLTTVGRMCGIPAGDKQKKNTITKIGHLHSYCVPIYGGENSDDVLQLFKELVLTWIPA